MATQKRKNEAEAHLEPIPTSMIEGFSKTVKVCFLINTPSQMFEWVLYTPMREAKKVKANFIFLEKNEDKRM